MSVVKHAKEKVEKAWSLTKKIFVLSCLWGLVFSVVTISHLGVAFDYDDTLVDSTAAYAKAHGAGVQTFSPEFWAIVNQSYDLERPKLLTYPLAWIFRMFGFKIAVITGRPGIQTEPLKKEWRHLVARQNFFFDSGGDLKRQHLQSGNYVLFIGDSDSDVQEARRAKVYPVRIRRSSKSIYKEDYHPGTFGELVVPFSEF